MARWLTLTFFVVSMVTITTACGRNKPPRDHSPPSLQCPKDKHKTADSIQINTKVSWTEPTAQDSFEKRKISAVRDGQAPGKLFSEGTSVIQYTAKDNSGNAASCKFNIKVKVIRCRTWGAQTDGWKQCHPSHDMRYGTVCRFGCYAGHVLEGPSRAECQSNGQWTVKSQPRCKKNPCDKLIPKMGQENAVDIHCTDGSNYRSICSYNCREGYSVTQGHSKVRVCGADGDWKGSTPYCKDSSPPKFKDCPYAVIIYTDKLKDSAVATWNLPQVTDNSGHIKPTQTGGPISGSDLRVGEYEVMYTAKDRELNSASCKFGVIVKQIKCPTIYPLPYTSVSCPSGRVYGAKCYFACHRGTESSLPLLTSCKKIKSTHHYGLWDFGNHQPYCERKNPCIELEPPDNGALACDLWQYGHYCSMMCQQGYTVMSSEGSRIHQGLLVCSDAGKWRPTDIIPNCGRQGRRRVRRSDARFPLGYYDGPCQAAQDVIKENFLKRFTNMQACDPPKCSISNVKVICGQTTKRSTSSEIVVTVTFELSANMTYPEVVAEREALKETLREAQMNGTFDVTIGNQTLEAQSVHVTQLETTCDEGSVPDISKPLTCVQCGPGYYHNSSIQPSVCSQCDIGFYQDQEGQTSCKRCPPGMTTEAIGAKECKEACPPGFYSEKGTTPCDPCDIGYYADRQATREKCSPCSGSKTTTMTGSTSIDACFEFDIVFYNITDDESEAPAFVVNTSIAQELSLTMWFRCTVCANLFTMTADDPDSNDFLTISALSENMLIVESTRTLFEQSDVHMVSYNWHHLYVTWSTPSTFVYFDGAMIANDTMFSETLPSSVNITVGGEGFIGEISQFNMYSFPVMSSNSSVQFDECTSNISGDLLSWKHFSDLDGSFVITRSICDAFDNCLSSPCYNDGVCFDEIDGYTCTCADGFSGSDCSINIDDCAVSVCDNGGTCVDGVAGYNCTCPPGYRGALCEIKMVDGRWGQYSEWTLCSATCGTGQQSRYRTCDNPEPSNGGSECEGDSFETRDCQIQECINECIIDLDPLINGSLNCEWDSDNETRRCYPMCAEGYEFDSDLFVDPPNVYCGPTTGHVWNIRSSDNPDARLPSCQEKVAGNVNILNYTASYRELSQLNDELLNDVKRVVADKVSNTTCVSQERCNHTYTYVELKQNTSDLGQNSTLYVMFTAQIICEIHSDMDECYSVLEGLVYEMNAFIDARELTVNYSGSSYDVTANSTLLGGTTGCDSGHVPVINFCVACGQGMYQSGDFCERCPVGYYQNDTAQVNCKQCPKEWTTHGLQSNNVMQCNVPIEPSFTLFYAILFIGVAVTVMVALTAFFGDSFVFKQYIVRIRTPFCQQGSKQTRDTIEQSDNKSELLSSYNESKM